MNELEYLKQLRSLPLHEGARGLEDDCAVLAIGEQTLVITHDMMAEGTHYLPDARMADVAWKLVSMNLSDLASKGARPVGVILGSSLGREDAEFLEGLRDALLAYDVPLLGGDTIAALGASTFAMTAIGEATHHPVPSRKGARPGDGVFVTGTLGAAMLGFEGKTQYVDAFNRPRARLEEGYALVPHVTAMMDISDGLMLDAWRMANASSVTFRLNPELIPVADSARFDDCIRWGDDYELLFTCPHGLDLPVGAIRIGAVEERRDAPIFLGGTPHAYAANLGYRHG